ncbi:hypothetical protein J6894_02774 [Nakaseomyces glabratus]|nr:hypothetical protein J6894_02774 [Nakaseomyces glabratus]
MPLIGKYFHFLILCLLSLIGLVLAANPVPLTNVCYFPEEYPRQAGFRAITAGLASTILQGSVDELLNYSGLSSLTTQQTTTTTPNFQLPTLPLPTNVYGLTVVPLYLLVQLQGYFVPPVSGQYTFSLENTNDAAIIFFGNPSAFPCGDLSAWPQASADDITVTDGTFPSRTLFLKAGVAYPMRISYYNSLGSGNLAVSFTDPGGTKRTNWNGYIWRYDSCSTCTYTPPPAGTTIYSSGWLLDSTTVTTSYSLYTGIDGVESTYTLYKVGVPTITPSLEVPPLTTVTLSYNEYNEENVVSYYSTTTDDGSPIIASTTLTIRTIYSEAPEPITITIEIQPGLTHYEIISYWTTTNADGQFITTSTSTTYSPPPVGTVSVYENHELVEDVYSYFITLDGSGNIITDSVLISATTIYDAAPEPSTNVIDLGEEVTGYEVISFYTTVDGDGKVVTTSTSTTYSPPPVGTVSVYENHELVEDVYSYFITLDGSGNIITDSVLISATTIYDAAPEPSTNVIDLGEEVTGYEVISFYTTVDGDGKVVTTSTSTTYSPPPVGTVSVYENHELVEDVYSYFITLDGSGNIITDSVLISATTIYDAAPEPSTNVIDLGEEVTGYEVISFYTTVDGDGKVVTTSTSTTYSPPPVGTVSVYENHELVEDVYSYFITLDGSGNIITDSVLISATTIYDAAPEPSTNVIDLGEEVTGYEVISFYTTVDGDGKVVTTSTSTTYSPPPVGTVSVYENHELVEDVYSYFITLDGSGNIITDSVLISATTIYDAAPEPSTNVIDLGEEVTGYEVISFYTTVDGDGKVVTTSTSTTYSPPPVGTVSVYENHELVEDVYSYFITLDGSGNIITDSVLISATTIYDAAPEPSTNVIDLGEEVTGYEVISFYTTVDGDGKVVTTSTSTTYSPPPVGTVSVYENHELVEDVYSYFITLDGSGNIITDSVLISATTIYDAAPEPSTNVIDLGEEVTGYEVISFYTTVDGDGKVVTTSTSTTYSPPPVGTVSVYENHELVEDVYSYFITLDGSGNIITDSVLISATTIYDAAPEPSTNVIDLGEEVTGYEVISFYTTVDGDGKVVTTSTSTTYSPPPVGTVSVYENHELVEDVYSYFITLDGSGNIITDSVLISATTIYDAAPEPSTNVIDLGEEVTGYEVISFYTTVDGDGKVVTTSTSTTYSPPPVGTVSVYENHELVEDVYSYFITLDGSGNIITDSVLISATTIYDAAPEPSTNVIDLGEEVTGYEVISFYTTVDGDGKVVTTSTSTTYSPPPVGTVSVYENHELVEDVYSYFITLDGSGNIITDSVLISATTIYDAAPEPSTNVIDLGEEVTGYEVISFYTTVDGDGKVVTTSTSTTYSPPPVGTVSVYENHELVEDVYSYFITLDGSGNIITDSVLISATTIYDAAPEPSTNVIDLGEEVTGYEVISFYTTVDGDGKVVTTSTSTTYSPPPVGTVSVYENHELVEDVYSYFITLDGSGNIITDSVLISATTIYDAAPEPSTNVIDLGEEVTGYEVISFYTTVDGDGKVVTTSTSTTYSPPPVGTVSVYENHELVEDVYSYFITLDGSGNIITDSVLISATTIYDAAPEPSTNVIDLGEEVTGYEVISFYTTVDGDGKVVTTSTSTTYSPPPVGTVSVYENHELVEDVYSYFITLDGSGNIITDSVLISATTIYDAAPEPSTNVIDLGEEVTGYEVISFYTTVDGDGKVVTTSTSTTYSPPPVGTVSVYENHELVEDVYSYFITLDGSGNIITDSVLISATTIYDAAPEPSTNVIDLGEEVTGYEVISFYTTVDGDGKVVTTSTSTTYSPPPVGTVSVYENHELVEDVYSYFITLDGSGNIITDSVLISATTIYDAAPEPSTNVIDLGEEVTGYEVISFYTTVDGDGKVVTTSTSTTYSPPPVGTVSVYENHELVEDVYSYFITLDGSGNIITDSVLISATTIYDAAPEPSTNVIDLGEEVTGYEVISFYTTVDGDGKVVTTSTSTTYSPPPVGTVSVYENHELVEDVYSYFITLDGSGNIITDSVLISATTIYDAAPEPSTNVIDLGEEVTGYEVISFYTTVDGDGKVVTTSTSTTYSPPPVGTVSVYENHELVEDVYSYFITLDGSGNIITDSVLISATTIYDAAPEPSTNVIDLGEEVTGYEVISFYTTVDGDGKVVTTSTSTTYSPPPVGTVSVYENHELVEDVYSYFITLDGSGNIITDSVLISATTIYDAAPEPSTNVIDLGEEVTGYEVISFYTTVDGDGKVVTTSTSTTYSPPPVGTVSVYENHELVEDVYSYFITLDGSGNIITDSVLISATTIYDAAPEPSTNVIDLGEEVTGYEVISFYTTVDGDGKVVTTSTSTTYSPPPVGTVSVYENHELVEDVYSYFITLDGSGNIITDSVLISATTIYDAAPEPSTNVIDLGEEVTGYEVISFYTTVDGDGKVVTTSTSTTYSPPPVGTVSVYENHELVEDVYSYFITLDGSGNIITDSVLISATTIYDAAPEPSTNVIDLGEEVTGYEVISFYTTVDGDGKVVTTSTSTTYSPPPVGTVSVYENHELVEDVYSYFITLDGSGNIITDSVLISATTIYDAAPEPSTNVIDLGEEVTGYEVISFYTTVDGDGKVVTTSTSTTYSPPPVGTVSVYENHELVEDVYSYFITLDGSGNIITDSVLISATTIYDAAPEPSTNVIDLGEEVTGYEVISFYTTVDGDGKVVTTSTSTTYSPPPVGTVSVYENHELVEDVYSYFITLDGSGNIITDSVLISATTIYDAAPEPSTNVIDLGEEVTGYEVISFYTTVDGDGKVVTTSTSTTYSPPPVGTVSVYENHELVEDVYSYFITLDGSGNIITDSVLISATTIYDAAPEPSTNVIDLGEEVTGYEVVTYWTTTNEAGDLITTNSTVTYSPPAITVVGTTGSNYVESDWISFFITRDVEGQLVTGSTTLNGTREYIEAEVVETSLLSVPTAETRTIDSGNGVTEYEVVTHWTTTNEAGDLITTSSTVTYSPPAITVVGTTGSNYVESDWISFFITRDVEGQLVTGSTTLNGTREYIEAEVVETSLLSVPTAETRTIDSGNGVTEYEVVTHWTTTNEAGDLITTSSTVTYSPPAITVVGTTGSNYVESDWISFFITRDVEGQLVTGSTTLNGTREYIEAEVVETSLLSVPTAETRTIDSGNGVTEYEVVTHWTTTNEAGDLITTSSTVTYSPPAITVVGTTGSNYVESDWISFFITRDVEGQLVTGSTTLNGTREYIEAEVVETSLLSVPTAETRTIDSGNGVTEYEVVTHWTTTNEAGDLITTSSTVTYSPPAITVVGTTGSNYVESDWISFFITRDVEGQLVTGSTTLNGTREYIEAEVVETSLLSVPTAETRTIDSGNGVTEYEVVTHWTTTNEAGDLITTSSTVTYSPPAITVVGTTGSNYVESDWISFFITRDVEGQLVTGSTTLNGTREYIEAEVVETSLLSVPTAETRTIDSGNGVTEYEVVTHWTTTNEAGDLITTSSTVTYSPPAITVVGTTGSNYVESDWISFFITRDVEGQLVTGSSIVDHSFFSALNRTISNAGSNSLTEEASSLTSISELKPDIVTITNLKATSSITMSSYVSSAKRWSNSSKEIKISTSASAPSNKEPTKASSYYLKGTIVNTIVNAPGAHSSKNAISNSIGVHPPIKTDEATSATSSYRNSRMDTHSWVPSSKSSSTPSSVETIYISSVINQFENNTTLETRRKTNIESKMSQSSSHDNELYGSFYGGSPHTREGNLTVALVIILIQFLL